MNPFDAIPEALPDPIFGLSGQFKKDTRPEKYTFITGYFRGEDLITPVLETVANVEKDLAKEKGKKEYLPIDGDPEFTEQIETLVFGKKRDTKRICSFQTIGGTGALFLAGRLARYWTKEIAISDPTWANHWKIFSHAGLKTKPYPYYANHDLQFEAFLMSLGSLSEGTCVLIHTNCHNPTSLDLTHEQWQELAEVINKKQLFPILDMAYQGFANSPEEDAFAPRLFLEKEKEFALTYTCAKNFSIYGERAGALFVIAKDPKRIPAIRSQIKAEIRACYSNPPIHAAAIVKTILKTPNLHKQWLEELSQMRKRMSSIRNAFVDTLMKKDPNGKWEMMRKGKGLFFYSELSSDSIRRMREEKALYIAADGRINLTGLNEKNLETFVDALLKAR